MSPGPIGSGLPSPPVCSSLPWRTSTNSVLRCLCAGCGSLPGGSMVSWTSTNSPVGSVPCITARLSPPLAFFTTGSASKRKTFDSAIGMVSFVCPSAVCVSARDASIANAVIAPTISRRFIVFMLSPFLTSSLHIAADGHHEILRRSVADISHRMVGALCHVENGTGTAGFVVVFKLELHRAFLHHDDFAVLDAVHGVGRHAGNLRRLMQGHDLARDELPTHDVAALAAVRHFSDRHFGEAKNFADCHFIHADNPRASPVRGTLVDSDLCRS